MSGPRQRGFTLIELMISVSVIGVLASVAIPSFGAMQMRSRMAERSFMMTAIYRAMDDMYMREARFPLDLGGGESYLNLMNPQPNATLSTAKVGWRSVPVDASDHWGRLALIVEGSVYYRYVGFGYTSPSSRTYRLEAYGDLDGDGQENRWTKEWVWVAGEKQRVAGSTLPCGDCTAAYETNPWTY
jgi:prepilin-type N-terminal cleavage/methylation domain-containing protein